MEQEKNSQAREQEKEWEARRDRLCASYDMVRQFVILCGVPREHREDMVQEVFVSAWSHLDQLRDIDRMQPWLYRITRNRAARFFLDRRERKKRETEIADWYMEQIGGSEGQLPGMESAERALLRDMIRELRPPAPRILQLRFGMGFTLKEIAKMLQMNYNTVRTIEHRALEKLRKGLEEAQRSADGE